MRLIFLDFDGVLNSYQSTMYWDRHKLPEERLIHKLCPIATSNLQFLLDKCPDLDIVISSTWRKIHELEWIKDHLWKSGVDGSRVRGRTPVMGSRMRGQEIDLFIKEWHEDGYDRIQDFIIIDDNADMAPHMDKLVQTNPNLGLSWDDVEKIALRFKIDKMPIICF